MNKLQEIEVRHLEIKMSSRILENNNKSVSIPTISKEGLKTLLFSAYGINLR